jgi:transcriptional regulator with XRE-family HTH domain
MSTFDRVKFAQVLDEAKGNRSINQFGIACKVDPGYLSRLLRGLLKNPPSPAILQKIATQADNGISYQDLMQAAGFWSTMPEKDTHEDSVVLNMHGLLREMNAFFRMQPNLTPEEKDIFLQDMREYFRFKAGQARQKK